MENFNARALETKVGIHDPQILSDFVLAYHRPLYVCCKYTVHNRHTLYHFHNELNCEEQNTELTTYA